MSPGAKSVGKETAMQHNGKFDFGKNTVGDEPSLTLLAAPKPRQSRLSPKESKID